MNKSQYKRYKTRLKRQRINVIFNYSSLKLTPDMETVLNKGLNFAILPLCLDLTQVLTDFKRFERTMIWTEFWYGRESEKKKKPIFKNTKSPNHLKNYLTSVKSELLDPRNRNKAKCNIPENELKAIQDLIKLQKERKIMIKVCDKGAGIIILDFEAYMKACHEHLESETPDGEKYYTQVTQSTMKKAKT